jgi:hypothetical protein
MIEESKTKLCIAMAQAPKAWLLLSNSSISHCEYDVDGDDSTFLAPTSKHS